MNRQRDFDWNACRKNLHTQYEQKRQTREQKRLLESFLLFLDNVIRAEE